MSMPDLDSNMSFASSASSSQAGDGKFTPCSFNIALGIGLPKFPTKITAYFEGIFAEKTRIKYLQGKKRLIRNNSLF